MTTKYEEMVSKLTDFLKSETKTETVIGEQFKLGEFTCVPVIRVGMGMGFGSGEGGDVKSVKGEGGGGGAGFGIEPMGFLVTHGAEINFVPVKSSRGLSAAFEKMPDILDKYLEQQKKVKEPEPVA